MESRSAHLRNLRELTPEEVEEKVNSLKRELFGLRFQLMAGRIENPAKIRATRREIARNKTIGREKALKKEHRPA
jgi:large subunit ribosomal protein L29